LPPSTPRERQFAAFVAICPKNGMFVQKKQWLIGVATRLAVAGDARQRRLRLSKKLHSLLSPIRQKFN
jgi:hypothetical protein